jgi:hypothetical protein
MDTSKKLKKIFGGNAIHEGQNDNRRGWFIGSFIAPQTLLKTNKELEVKWGIHSKGEKRSSKATDGLATTISLLIKGKCCITFEGQKKMILSNPGDYIIWTPNIPHVFESYEDSVVITIRWPSLSAKKN